MIFFLHATMQESREIQFTQWTEHVFTLENAKTMLLKEGVNEKLQIIEVGYILKKAFERPITSTLTSLRGRRRSWWYFCCFLYKTQDRDALSMVKGM